MEREIRQVSFSGNIELPANNKIGTVLLCRNKIVRCNPAFAITIASSSRNSEASNNRHSIIVARCKSVSVRSFDLPSRIETFSVSVVTRRFPAIIAIKPPGCLDRPVPSTLGLPSPICRAADDYGNNRFASIATRNNDTDTAAASP